MGAKYALYENPNPKGDGKKQPLHARIVPRGTIHTQEIAEEIADSCGYSTATTKGMLDALAKVISKNLRYGYTVELDDLGSFSISLKSRPVMDKKEIRSWSVNFGNVHFKGSKKLKNRLKSIDLERDSDACAANVSESMILRDSTGFTPSSGKNAKLITSPRMIARTVHSRSSATFFCCFMILHLLSQAVHQPSAIRSFLL